MARRTRKGRVPKPVAPGHRTVAGAPRQRPAAGAAHRLPRGAWLARGGVALALLLTRDDRYPGATADGRQMAWTAVALVETGEMGQARGRDFTWPRLQGDAVSRFGLGMSLAQVPAAWFAPRVEERFGPGSSQPLFIVVPFLCVCLGAWAAAVAAASLGAGPAGTVAALLLASVASPLGSYAALDLSEPLQAASLALTLALAVMASQSEVTPRQAAARAALAGFAAGVAVLTKSSLLIVVPFALLPLLAPGGAASVAPRAAAAFAGFIVPGGLWLWFEIARFGGPFASYGGEGFTHPFLDGTWRLVAGPNRGLLLYFPALALAVAAAPAAWRERWNRRTLAVMGALGVFLALLALAAPWWAWHGVWGWGPRLLVPAVPALAVPAALALARWPRGSGVAFLVVCVAINVPALLQNPVPVTAHAASCEWPVADEAFARSLATYARREGPPGTFRVAPVQVLETVPAASPFVVYPWFASVTWTRDVDDAARRLQSPPWVDARPDIPCRQPQPPDFVRRLLRRPGWPIWGRGFWPDAAAPGFPGVYDEGLLDQVVRAQQLGRAGPALELARKLARLAPGGEADALVLESWRLMGRRSEAAEYLSSVPRERRAEPKINVVLALFERDAGNESMARGLLGSVAPALRGTPAETALSAPLTDWPRDLFSMTAQPTDQAGR